MVRLAAFFFAHSAMSAAQTARLTAFGSSKKCLFMRLFSFLLIQLATLYRVARCGTTLARYRVDCQALYRAFCVLHKTLYRALCKLTLYRVGRKCYILYIKINRGNIMAVSARKRLNNDKYNAKCTQINLKPLTPEANAIKAAAKASEQSIQGYILQAVRERMAKEGQPLTLDDLPGADSVGGDSVKP